MKQKKPLKKSIIQGEEDKYLWGALRVGDAFALNELFKKHYNDLFFYGLKIVGNHCFVADSIQDLFANIWEKRIKLKDVTYVKAYLFTSLRNNLLKLESRNRLLDNDGGTNARLEYNFDISPEEIYLESETIVENRRIIEELLAELSPKQKEIIYLKFYGNYSNTEIGEILSIEQQSVANLLGRTIKTLKKKRQEHNFPIYNLLISHLL